MAPTQEAPSSPEPYEPEVGERVSLPEGTLTDIYAGAGEQGSYASVHLDRVGLVTVPYYALLRPLTAPRDAEAMREAGFQARTGEWMLECFGKAITLDRRERMHRFLEEALELAQACGGTADEARDLVAYVWGRETGEASQEVGGVLVTLAALCNAAAIDMATAGETELARVWTKVEAIRAKHAAKPSFGPRPGPSAPSPETVTEGLRAENARLRSALNVATSALRELAWGNDAIESPVDWADGALRLVHERAPSFRACFEGQELHEYLDGKEDAAARAALSPTTGGE